MRFEKRRWLVIPVSKIDDINFSEVHEPNAESLRKSIDGTQTFVKYEINSEEYTEYNHTDILALLNTEAWTKQD